MSGVSMVWVVRWNFHPEFDDSRYFIRAFPRERLRLCWQSAADASSFTHAILTALAEAYHFDLDTPFRDYPQKIKDVILHGTGGQEVRVHYRGQRGEGVYDVAFEG